MVLKRLELEWHYHQRPDLEQADQQLLQYAIEFGRLLNVVYRWHFFPALREECIWYAGVFGARGSNHDAFALVLDSWIMAIQGLLKPPECNELARPLQSIRDDLDRLIQEASARRKVSIKTVNPALLKKLIRGDVQGARKVIAEFAAEYVSPDRLIVEVMLPAMAEVGQGWQSNELEIFQEHLATEAIRGLLAGLTAMRPENRQERNAVALVSCGPGDAHELIPLALASYLTFRGWSVKNLGVGLPANQIARAVAAFEPNALFLTFTMLSRFEEVLDVIAQVHRASESCRVIVGGRGAVAARAVLEDRGVRVALDFDEGFRLAGEDSVDA
ncbi:cobalamin B12-binding domain-containing protein [Desulfobulbus alkaliphilus]|uniref:cobalamin B12-binding domain-containing protein n=1 Tax=Desulfobulbus alkaliphilus TaxID=869814 RepID=UPI0019665E57|nr:B12-binding domain-containing protein [Desulfobulbus alkaliphilus]MBM9535859.1 B12-binding domain-containing protein [Desulfobulbus alkaliphilus]